MSSCTTIYGSDQTFTNYYTNTITSVYTSSGSAYTTSTPIVASSCVTPTCASNSTSCGDPVCSTSTSYQAETITGGAQTITSYATSVGSYLSTSYGGTSTSCVSISSAPPVSSPPSSSSQYTPPTTSSTPTSTHTSSSADVTSTDAPLTSTSFSTVFVTSIGSNGQTSVIAVPTLLNSGSTSSSSHKSNAGAIGGGVVGGVLALLVALGFLFFLKRKGVFSKSGNEFGDDMWRPSDHSGDGGAGDHTEYAGQRGSGDGSSGIMAEKEGGSFGHMGRQSYLGTAELGAGTGAVQPMQERVTSPVGVDGYVDATSSDGHQRPVAAYRESRVSDYGVDMGAASGYAAGAGGQRLSHRQSLQSGSGHSHDNHAALMPDPRLSGHYLYQPNVYDAGYAGATPVEHLLDNTNSESVASDHSDSRTAATTGSTVQHSMPMPSSKRLMANLSDGSSAVPRPTLQPLAGSDSFGSSGDSSLFSNGTNPSTAASSMSGGQKSPLVAEAPKQVTNLKGRPGINRHDSADSLLAPSQFLGARIMNVTPAEEKAQYEWTRTKA